jgi:deoxyadenosine/deoxycytidine kinase
MFIGNIGCGKSTWLKALNKNGYNTVAEDLSEITFLQDYWTNHQFSFHTQIGFYASWLNLYNRAEKIGGAFIDSSIMSHHLVFTKYMSEHSLLTSKEFHVCNQLYEAIMNRICHECVFLYCELEECTNIVIS